MNDTHDCLESDAVDKVGEDKLTPVERQAVEGHLSNCSSCRAMFAKTLDAPDWTDQILPVLIESSVSNSGSRAEGDPFEYESVRQLFGPSDDPSMLGRIGPYEVMGVIGAGGMGVVLKAFDRTLDRIVAIKMLLPQLAASSQARRRFSREGKAAAAVVDDHVLPIYGVDEWNGHPYLVTQYSNGMSLQKRILDQGPLQLQEILRIAMQSARGLAAAHAQGIVHRDVKPSNILLDRTVERALLTDFGLARATDDASITRTGTIAGTPHYMSPEQVRNEPVDERSDLFSLGCTIYAMCTGRSPFMAESSYAVLRNITDASPRPVRSANEEIPEWFECIVMRLLSKSSVDRFQSAEETADVLERCLAHVQNPSSSPLPDSVTSLVSQRRRSPWFGWMVAFAAALVLLSAGVIVLESNMGTLTIESDSDVPIRITQDDKPIKRFLVSKKKKSVRLAAGIYTVKIDGQFDAMVVSGDNVVLRRGDQATVEIKKSQSRDELASDVHIAERANADTGASSLRQELIVDLYCGADTLPSMNVPGRATQYVRMLEQLNAIEGVVVNFRVSGPGKQISEAIVRAPHVRSRREVVASEHRSESQAAINAVLRSAGVEKVEWMFDEGAPTATDTNVSSRALVLLMHPPHVADGNALQQAATSVALGQLAASDYLGVLTFAPGGAGWAWGGSQGLVQIGDRRADMLQSIVDLKVTDTPEYDTALRLALAAFVDTKAANKRMLILTNGDPSLLNPEILNSFREQGVTISVVHVTSYGDKYAAVPERMTVSTGGIYYRMDKVRFRPAMIEEIFRKEALTLDKQHQSKTGQQADQTQPGYRKLRDTSSSAPNVDKTGIGETSPIHLKAA